MKNEKTNLIIWAVVALVIGVLIGTFLIAPTTTGNAKGVMDRDSTTTKEQKQLGVAITNLSGRLDELYGREKKLMASIDSSYYADYDAGSGDMLICEPPCPGDTLEASINCLYCKLGVWQDQTDHLISLLEQK